jgi:hypothetical protein
MIPAQKNTPWYPLKPDSPKVGTSGYLLERAWEDRKHLVGAMNGSDGGTPPNSRSIPCRPNRRSHRPTLCTPNVSLSKVTTCERKKQHPLTSAENSEANQSSVHQVIKSQRRNAV